MSPHATVSEVELSTRIPGFPGVYAGIVIPAKKGPIDGPVLVTSEADLLRTFTPEERIEPGYSLAYYSALAYLEKANKLWVSRAVAFDAKVGGAVVKSTSHANFSWTSGLSIPSAYEFGSNEVFAIYAKDPGEWASKIGVKISVSRDKITQAVSATFATASLTFAKSVMTGGSVFADVGAFVTGDPVVIRETTASAFVVTSTSYVPATGVFTAGNVVTGTPLRVTFGGAAANLISGNVYYAINASSTTFKLAVSAADATAGTVISLVGSTLTDVVFTPVCLTPPELVAGRTYYYVKIDGTTSGLARTLAEAVANVRITFSAFGSAVIFDRLNCLDGFTYGMGEGVIFDAPFLPQGLVAGLTYFVSVINARAFLAPSYTDALAGKNLLNLAVYSETVDETAINTANSTVNISSSLATGALVTLSGSMPRPLIAATYAVIKVQEGLYRFSPTTADALLGSYVSLQSLFSETLATGAWSAADNSITVVNNYPSGTRVKFVGTPGAPLKEGETYFVLNQSSTLIKLAATSGGTLIDITAAAVGNCTLVEQVKMVVTGAGNISMASPVVIREAGAFVVQVFRTRNKNDVVESFTASLDASAKDGYGRSLYLEDVLTRSNYVRATINPAVLANDVTVVPTPSLEMLVLEGGSDGSPVTDGPMLTAADCFANRNERQLTVLMDGGWTTPNFHGKLAAIASNRGDCVAFLSAPYSAESSANFLNDIVDYRVNILGINNSYAVMYSPHVKIYDKFNDTSIFVAPDGYAAAALSFTAMNYEMWFPIGGFKRGALAVSDVRRRYSKGEMDYLYDNGINPIRFYPGKGINIWGQRTLQSNPSATDRLNVRLLLVVLKPAIEDAMDSFLFELNDDETRANAKAKLDAYLEGVKARRGVTAFRTQCDTENNLPSDIDEGRLVMWVFVKPTRSVEEVKVPLAITSTGMSFSTAAQSL